MASCMLRVLKWGLHVSLSYFQKEEAPVWFRENGKERWSRGWGHWVGGGMFLSCQPEDFSLFQLCNIFHLLSLHRPPPPPPHAIKTMLQYHIRITWPVLIDRSNTQKNTRSLLVFQNKTKPLCCVKSFPWCAPVLLQQHAPVGNSHKPKLILLHLLLQRGKKHTYLRLLNPFFHISYSTAYRIILQIKKGVVAASLWLSRPLQTDWPSLSLNFLFLKTGGQHQLCWDNRKDVVERDGARKAILTDLVSSLISCEKL